MMMTQNEITPTQARALAALLHELRPDWDSQGLLFAIHGARTKDSNFELCVAAIRAAGTASVRTPAVIGMDGPHWQPIAVSAKPASGGPIIDAPGRCIDCGGFHHPHADCDPPEEHRTGPTGDYQAARRALKGARSMPDATGTPSEGA